MPVDNWLILAYIMIFSSVILCGLLPMILRLYNAHRRFHRYDLERRAIAYSCPNAFLRSQSIYSDVQVDIADLPTDYPSSYARIDSHEHPNIYEQIPFIDEDTSV
jgi:hypothetical protein